MTQRSKKGNSASCVLAAASLHSLAGAIDGLAIVLGRDSVRAGAWIKVFNIHPTFSKDFSNSPNVLNHVLIILSHATNLTHLSIRPRVEQCVLIALLAKTCAQTLTYLDVDLSSASVNSIVYINDLKSLTTLFLDSTARSSTCHHTIHLGISRTSKL
jgi:hypothetical protein